MSNDVVLLDHNDILFRPTGLCNFNEEMGVNKTMEEWTIGDKIMGFQVKETRNQIWFCPPEIFGEIASFN